jgi:hypothetical protein
MSAPSPRLIVTVAISIVSSMPTTASATRRQPDFNGDGFADLVAPAMGDRVISIKYAGGVNIIYGTASGLAAAGNQFWSQGSPGIAENPEKHDYFGYAVAWGDFNNDDFSDLLVSAAVEDGMGAVHVIYGSAAGLTNAGDQYWVQGSGGVLGTRETGELFGFTVAVGDFNGDAHDDIAIGVPDETVNTRNYAGAVNVLYGSPDGITADGNQLWTQDSPGIMDIAEFGEEFGYRVAAGDFNDDGKDDLVVGMPYETNTHESDGAVHVIYGSSDGLTAAGNQFWNQDSPGVGGLPQEDDHFGGAICAGDFNDDGRDDLAIGSPRDKIVGTIECGSVTVLYGRDGNGLNGQGSQVWTQDSGGASGIIDNAEANDEFGATLASGDFDHNGRDDLVIGVLHESIGVVNKTGAVNVLYGTLNGLAKAGNQFWTQDAPGIRDNAESNDLFSSLLIVGDFDGDGRDDLGVGVAFENVGGIAKAGAMNVLYGAGNQGLSKARNQFWHQNSPGIEGVAGTGDCFGLGID